MLLILKSLFLLLVCCYAAHATCPEHNQIHCKTNDHCIRIHFICDGDNDCGDSSDEDSRLCGAWKNSDCDRNNVQCVRNGRSDCIPITHYCDLDNPPCEGSLDLRLCKMLKDRKIQDLDSVVFNAAAHTEEFKKRLDSSIRHKDCPVLYTKIGNQCVSILFVVNLDWMESRAFCQAIGGDLFTVKKDLSNFFTIMQHLRDNHATNDFWIGGMYKNETLGWKWIDDTDMPQGTPFWAVRHTSKCAPRLLTSQVLNITSLANDGFCYAYKQAPASSPSNHCTAMTYQHYYFFSDENCMTRKSPLCVLQE